MGAKLDLYKLHKEEYATPKKPTLVNVKPAKYLAITGRGEPGSAMFAARLGALYNVAFTIKMAKKFAGQDYAVSKLEGLWWGTKKKADFLREPKSSWNWKLIIRTPEFIDENHLATAVSKLREKGKGKEIADVRLEVLEEGLCVQMLHIGSYDREAETLAMMKEFAQGLGRSVHGLHHEIYLSDPRRVPPERLRTILRLPVR